MHTVSVLNARLKMVQTANFVLHILSHTHTIPPKQTKKYLERASGLQFTSSNCSHLIYPQVRPLPPPHHTTPSSRESQSATHTAHVRGTREQSCAPQSCCSGPSSQQANHPPARPAQCHLLMAAPSASSLFANWVLGRTQRGCGVGQTWATSP